MPRSNTNHILSVIDRIVTGRVLADYVSSLYTILQSADRNQFTLMYRLTLRDDVPFMDALNTLNAERGSIRNELNGNRDIRPYGVSFQDITVTSKRIPATCFNGVKDAGETDVDCGNDACGTACEEGKRCRNNPDCAQICFMTYCQYTSSAARLWGLSSIGFTVFATVLSCMGVV